MLFERTRGLKVENTREKILAVFGEWMEGTRDFELESGSENEYDPEKHGLWDDVLDSDGNELDRCLRVGGSMSRKWTRYPPSWELTPIPIQTPTQRCKFVERLPSLERRNHAQAMQ